MNIFSIFGKFFSSHSNIPSKISERDTQMTKVLLVEIRQATNLLNKHIQTLERSQGEFLLVKELRSYYQKIVEFEADAKQAFDLLLQAGTQLEFIAKDAQTMEDILIEYRKASSNMDSENDVLLEEDKQNIAVTKNCLKNVQALSTKLKGVLSWVQRGTLHQLGYAIESLKNILKTKIPKVIA